ncbi:hypothetical protein [Sinorhizobium americanum]|uniref:Uncharacterized protein n=1 Tax=Sinorhizobium americanum TaxID=194963 RepID=A0A1L3LQ42_9HYPH|nr:hypothetical protein [Sinorhizobium americanum]APG85507.1 hypothetical protein SAMCCGM7_Ch2770 [Sinorhizobium americanum CCGM7]APG92166.1 hypothetical protein SAMCFNEI73_Ch2893 [Sinorhizobium americanum]OAP34692.1 hypothetical protein ATC00_15285 [Sinorhizobium americanum]TCN32615.1 hypothetical protein EV184_104283 [Sinorhizobium americanum]
MPLGIVNFSFDLFAPWREQFRIRSESAPRKAADEPRTDMVDRSDEEQERRQALFWGLFPVL